VARVDKKGNQREKKKSFYNARFQSSGKKSRGRRTRIGFFLIDGGAGGGGGKKGVSAAYLMHGRLSDEGTALEAAFARAASLLWPSRGSGIAKVDLAACYGRRGGRREKRRGASIRIRERD